MGHFGRAAPLIALGGARAEQADPAGRFHLAATPDGDIDVVKGTDRRAEVLRHPTPRVS
jgi:hypothetical protein